MRLMPVLLLLAMACAHTDPFPPGQVPDNGPRAPVLPLQLTYNTGQDRTPAWSPDGSRILYSFDRSDQTDHDHCIGVLPGAGGTLRATKCYPYNPRNDSSEVLETPTLASDGRLAWLDIGDPAPTSLTLRLGSLASADRGRILVTFPYISTSGQRIDLATHLAWLGSQSLVFVGAGLGTVSPCSICLLDTLVIGHEVTVVNLASNPPALAVVSGTTNATSVWADRGGQLIYFTLGGDSVVYLHNLASGLTAPLHDFGATGIARDVAVSDSVLTAIVGGNVSFGVDPTFGPLQADSGGFLHVVNLNSGRDTLIDLPGLLLRHAALSPQGDRVVAEAYAGAGARVADLWLVATP